QGPKALGKVSGGVPRRAVLASSAFGFFAVLLSYWYPTTVFAWLLNMVGGVVLIVWGFIAASQLILRRRLEREAPEKLVVRMWAFPVLTWVTLAGVAGALVLMGLETDTRIQLYSTGGLALALAVVGYVQQRAAAATRPADD
ncbi:amino acid permease, partial [Streptomyces sp. AA8]|nr:amino acid permease [Streptomyces telluris]